VHSPQLLTASVGQTGEAAMMMANGEHAALDFRNACDC
jgi:hypothetical protein